MPKAENLIKIEGVEKPRTALEFQAPKRTSKERASGQLGTRHPDKCNICQVTKGLTEPWIDHNISERHICVLMNKRGFGQAVQDLEKLNRKNLYKFSLIFVIPGIRTRFYLTLINSEKIISAGK